MTTTRRDFLGLAGAGLAAGALPVLDVAAVPAASPLDQFAPQVGYLAIGSQQTGTRSRGLYNTFFSRLNRGHGSTPVSPAFANWDYGALDQYAANLFGTMRIVVAGDSIAAVHARDVHMQMNSTVPLVVAITGVPMNFPSPHIVAFSDQGPFFPEATGEQFGAISRARARELLQTTRDERPPRRVWVIYNETHPPVVSLLLDNTVKSLTDPNVAHHLDPSDILDLKIGGNPGQVQSKLDAATPLVAPGDAAIVLPDPVTSTAKRAIITWINAVLFGWGTYGHGDFTSVGGLMHYGISRDQLLEDAADVVAYYLATGSLRLPPTFTFGCGLHPDPNTGANLCAYDTRRHNRMTKTNSRVEWSTTDLDYPPIG